jgi:hypothetical protein
MENGGAALAPLMAGFIARSYDLATAILVICIGAWILCSILLSFVIWLVPADIAVLRGQMRERAEIEKAAQSA